MRAGPEVVGLGGGVVLPEPRRALHHHHPGPAERRRLQGVQLRPRPAAVAARVALEEEEVVLQTQAAGLPAGDGAGAAAPAHAVPDTAALAAARTDESAAGPGAGALYHGGPASGQRQADDHLRAGGALCAEGHHEALQLRGGARVVEGRVEGGQAGLVLQPRARGLLHGAEQHLGGSEVDDREASSARLQGGRGGGLARGEEEVVLQARWAGLPALVRLLGGLLQLEERVVLGQEGVVLRARGQGLHRQIAAGSACSGPQLAPCAQPTRGAAGRPRCSQGQDAPRVSVPSKPLA
mmetsp:Transcript_16221/g.51013  ORF Transcript_16221/g.51013 Transcript_16221/m.51013 type:complete len:295 (+) Transcript_16221:498-1382(+)